MSVLVASVILKHVKEKQNKIYKYSPSFPLHHKPLDAGDKHSHHTLEDAWIVYVVLKAFPNNPAYIAAAELCCVTEVTELIPYQP